MDDVSWAALTLSLTVLGGIATWVTYQRRGVTSGLRMLAFTLLPLAAYLTRTLQMFTRIVNAVQIWASGLVFHPSVWAGIIIAGLSVALFAITGAMRARELGGARKDPASDTGSDTGTGSSTRALRRAPAAQKAGQTKAKAGSDPELDEIEALLRKHNSR